MYTQMEHPEQFKIQTQPEPYTLSAEEFNKINTAAKKSGYSRDALIAAFVERATDPDRIYELNQLTAVLQYVTRLFKLPKFVVKVHDHAGRYSNKYRHSYDMTIWTLPSNGAAGITLESPENIVDLKLRNWKQITNFAELKNLKSFACRVSDLPPSLILPPTLEHLDLSNTNCQHVNWKDLVNLKTFNGNNTSNISYAIAFPESLETLNLAQSACGIVNWDRLHNLKTFIGHNNRALHERIAFPVTLKTLVLNGATTRIVNWNELTNLSSLTISNIPDKSTLPVSLESLTIEADKYHKQILLDDLDNLKVLNINAAFNKYGYNSRRSPTDHLYSLKLPYAAGGINVWDFVELVTADGKSNTDCVKRAIQNIIKLPPSLEQLAITNIDLGSIFWEDLTNLRRISINDVDSCAGAPPVMLTLPKTLTSFYIKNCKTAVVVNWENLTELTTLVVSDVSADNDPSAFLRGMSESVTNVEFLYLSGVNCKHLNISKLTNLSRFTCQGTDTLQRRLIFSPSVEYIKIPNWESHRINLKDLDNLKLLNDIIGI